MYNLTLQNVCQSNCELCFKKMTQTAHALVNSKAFFPLMVGVACALLHSKINLLGLIGAAVAPSETLNKPFECLIVNDATTNLNMAEDFILRDKA